MTEFEWLQGRDPRPMLELVGARASERKLRLFASACCRRIWPLLTDPRSRAAVEWAELQADGQADGSGWDAVRVAAREAVFAADLAAVDDAWASHAAYAAEAAIRATEPGGCGALRTALACASAVVDSVWEAEFAAQCRLLRDLFGNPLRPVRCDPAWVSGRRGSVANLAKTIYAERRFEDLPRLANALERAGCTTAAVLDHCRGPVPHVPGCWVVDALLGAEERTVRRREGAGVVPGKSEGAQVSAGKERARILSLRFQARRL